MPRRFVAVAAELARSASLLPPLSPPTLATANNSPTATMSVTPPSQNTIFMRHQHSTQLCTYNYDFPRANHQDSWRLRPASCQGRPVAALPGLHTACCYPRSCDQATRVTTPPLLPDPTLAPTTYQIPELQSVHSASYKFYSADYIDKYILRSELTKIYKHVNLCM